MTTNDRQPEGALDHLEEAVQAAEPTTKDYHIREALQLLRIADERSREDSD